MTLEQLYDLMHIRRGIGDIGAEVVLRPEDFRKLVREARASKPYIEIEADGKFTINTSQGPTVVRVCS